MDLSTISWIEGGVNRPRPPDKDMDLLPDSKIALQSAPPGKSINDLLKSGEVAGYIGARRPDALDTHSNIQRLFPNYREVELDYFRKTGIFPIMHTLVIREELYQKMLWIAESMFKALEASKAWGLDHMRFSGTMVYMLPWLNEEVEEIDETFGGDPYPYGLEANQKTLETLVQYLVEQHFISEPRPRLEDLFTPIVAWAE